MSNCVDFVLSSFPHMHFPLFYSFNLKVCVCERGGVAFASQRVFFYALTSPHFHELYPREQLQALSSLEAMGGPAGGTIVSSDLAPVCHLLSAPTPPNKYRLAVLQAGQYTENIRHGTSILGGTL